MTGKQHLIPKWAFVWDPRTKLIAGICYIFAVISLTTFPVMLVAYTLPILFLLLLKISIRLLLTRYLIITPFLILMTVPLLWNPGANNLMFTGLIILKAYTSMTILTIMLESESPDTLMNSLTELRIPAILVTILILSYRYIFLFLDDFNRMLIAVKSRFFRGGIQFKNLNVYGQLMAALLTRALERSNKMYQAMSARNFNGTFPMKKMKRIGFSDCLKIIFVIIIVLLFNLVERGCLIG